MGADALRFLLISAVADDMASSRLRSLRDIERIVVRMQADDVARLRAARRSWSTIGRALGLDAEACRARFEHPDG